MMGDVTGPISTLPGARHPLPKGAKCDHHRRRPAVVRIQGETDSFGSELNDMCQKCFNKHRAYIRSPEAAKSRQGRCDWCKNEATDLRPRRDFEEGLAGRLYDVCGDCVKKENERLAEEAEAYERDHGYEGVWDDDDYDDYDEGDHL